MLGRGKEMIRENQAMQTSERNINEDKKCFQKRPKGRKKNPQLSRRITRECKFHEKQRQTWGKKG